MRSNPRSPQKKLKKLLTKSRKCAIINTESEVRAIANDSPKRKLTKSELEKKLIGQVEAWIASGVPPDEAIERLTLRQYDFLIERGVNLDKYILTDEQIKVSSEVRRAERRLSPNGYNKKYPQSKQDLYNGIAEFIKSQGAEIIPREKQNYRDLDFTIDGTKYKIVLSNPRS